MYIDVRAQMGRVFSAHLGQRTSFLIAALAMRRVAQDFHGEMKNGDVPAKLA